MNILKKYTGRVPACGIFCGGCPTYIREKNPCLGAEMNKARCEKCKTFHLCCLDKGVSFCHECPSYPCTKLKGFAKRWLKYGQDQLENQKILKENGVEHFLMYFNSQVREDSI